MSFWQHPLIIPSSPDLPSSVDWSTADGSALWPVSSLPPTPCANSVDDSATTLPLSPAAQACVAWHSMQDVCSPLSDGTSSSSPTHSSTALPPSSSASASESVPPLEQQSRAPNKPSLPQPALLHRQANTARRHKENVALRRLDELNKRSEHFNYRAAPPTLAVEQKRSDKLSVLEASAERIQQLEWLLSASEEVNRASEAAMRRVSNELSSVLRHERRGLQWLDSARALHSSTLLDDRFSYLLMERRTGKALHANSAFYAVTGFTPSGVLQRIFSQSPMCPAPAPVNEVPLVRRKRHSAEPSRRVEQLDEEHWEWVPRPRTLQYPSTIQAVSDVMMGERPSCYVPIRTRCMDATYEMLAHVWAVDSEWMEEPDGRRWQQASTFIVAAAVDQYSLVQDEW